MSRAARLQDSGFRMWTLYAIEPEELDYAKMQAVSEGYQLRPEIIESAYYLYHYTKDPKYLEMGRVFFEDIVKYCRTANGYTTLRSVVTKEKGDRMHSFWLAETLKYLYLLFEPEAIDFFVDTADLSSDLCQPGQRTSLSLRCSRSNAIASRKFARHSSRDMPCPFAPGTSAQ